MSAWSKLPNAKHIDAVIASVKANPKKWARAWKKAGGWTEARNAAWHIARNTARDMAQGESHAAILCAMRDADVARAATWSVIGNADVALVSLWNAILALIAYDDCAYLLNTNPEHVKMLAGIGNEAAILLYPASIVFSEMKNECLV